MPAVIFEPTVFVVSRRLDDQGKQLREDVRNILDGSRPLETELAGAPTLDKWCAIVVEGHCRLAGQVTDHPLRRNGLIVTSALCAIDSPHFRWARTASRFYRLMPRYWNSDLGRWPN